jgi:sulfur-oxidizing protein SoxX
MNRKPVKYLILLGLIVVAQTVLAAEDGRIAVGKEMTFDRAKGNCLACHRIDDGELPGTLGPPLLAMNLRFPDREALKRQICDATIRQPDSRMPPFCRHGILTEEEVDLIVEYLYTL